MCYILNIYNIINIYINKKKTVKHSKMTENEKKLICEYCGINFKLKKTLHDHQKNSIKCLKKQGKNIIIHKCNNCEKEFKGDDAYRRHINKCYEIPITYGCIYKIEPIVEHNKYEIYFGSTKQNIEMRFNFHHFHYNKYINKDENYSYFSCYKLFDKYGIDNCNIEIVEKLENTTKNKLLKQENYYINTYYNVNEQNAYRSLDDDKQYYENYRIENKEKIKERNQNYYENNKEKILQQQKEKRDNMTEEERKQYLQHRKETRNAEQEKETKSKLEKCQYCNKEVRHDHINEHYNSNECRLARGEELIIYKCEYCDNEFSSNSMYLKHKYKCNKTQILTIHTDEKTCIFYKIYNKNNKNEYVVFYTHDDIKKAIRTDRYDYKKYLENKEIKQSKKPNIKCEFIEKNNGIDECEYEIIEEHKYKTTGNIGDDKKYCNNILKKYN